MHIIYRMCPEGNPNKERPQNMSKMELIKVCFDSVIKAFPNAEYTFLIDKPSVEIVDLADSCPRPHSIETTHHEDWGTGNMMSFRRQLEIAVGLDKVLLLEDDYYFNEGSGEIIESALDELQFLTPYDHPGYYTEDIHSYKRHVRMAGNHHWQNVTSTCLTFASKGEHIKRVKGTMEEFGWADHPMWSELTKLYDLWSPIPSLATHMETPFIAPKMEWLKN